MICTYSYVFYIPLHVHIYMYMYTAYDVIINDVIFLWNSSGEISWKTEFVFLR